MAFWIAVLVLFISAVLTVKKNANSNRWWLVALGFMFLSLIGTLSSWQLIGQYPCFAEGEFMPLYDLNGGNIEREGDMLCRNFNGADGVFDGCILLLLWLIVTIFVFFKLFLQRRRFNK